MGCYTVPTAAAIIHFFMRKKNPEWKVSEKHKTLNKLFLGGTIFGVVDHWWNGELFAFSARDILLGFVITASIMLVWLVMIYTEKQKLTHKSTN